MILKQMKPEKLLLVNWKENEFNDSMFLITGENIKRKLNVEHCRELV